MIPLNKKIVTDAENRMVAVSIDYQDWQKIEQLLAAHESTEANTEDRQQELEVKFTLQVRDIPEAHKQEAESKAKEAYIMTLLRHGDVSTGRAARLLGIPRVDVFDLMGEYGISVFPDYTPEELENEVAQAKKMLEKYKK